MIGNLGEAALPVLMSEINEVLSNMRAVTKEIESNESENQNLKTIRIKCSVKKMRKLTSREHGIEKITQEIKIKRIFDERIKRFIVMRAKKIGEEMILK